MNSYQYEGGELDLFKHAENWKRYWGSFIGGYLQGDVLEVGAGIGSNTLLLRGSRQKRWVCLEPDRGLAAQLQTLISTRSSTGSCRVIEGALDALAPEELFDVVMYIDVLEHIRDDRRELALASKHLKPNGRLILLAPAHNWLFSRFDKEIGHLRRYDKKTLAASVPKVLTLERLLYLDCMGLFSSLANRLFLKQSLPSLRQIRIWDKILVPGSRRLDGCFFYRVGKSILGIWRNGRGR